MLGGVAHDPTLLWAAGDYPVIARQLLPISEATAAAAGVGPGDRVLDVGVGDGNAAVVCARLGAEVVGIDLTPVQVERARARCAAEGLAVDLRVGDAQALDLPDRSFDVVLSVMAVIFAPDPAAASAELARVVRPGGRVAVTAWRAGGWATAWRERLSALVPEAVGPVGLWGTADAVAGHLAGAGLDAEVTTVDFAWRFPSVDGAVAVLTAASPPHVTALALAEARGVGQEARAALAEVVAGSNVATDGTCEIPAPWLLAVSAPRGSAR